MLPLLLRGWKGRQLVAAFCLTILAAGLAASQERSTPYLWADPFVDGLLTAAVEMMGVGAKSQSAAADTLLKVVEGNPEHRYAPDALLAAADCLRFAGAASESLTVLRKVLKEYDRSTVTVYPSLHNWGGPVRDLCGSWRAGLMHPPRDVGVIRKRAAERRDAERALKLYETYRRAFPESAGDWARYRLACLYLSELGNRPRAQELLNEVRIPDLRRYATLTYQDDLFYQRLRAVATAAGVKRRYTVDLRPRHWLAGQVRRLRVHLGLEREQKLTPEQEAEAKVEALRTLDAFWQEHKPEFESLALMEEEAEAEQKEK